MEDLSSVTDKQLVKIRNALTQNDPAYPDVSSIEKLAKATCLMLTMFIDWELEKRKNGK
jgi:hypothetical protein